MNNFIKCLGYTLLLSVSSKLGAMDLPASDKEADASDIGLSAKKPELAIGLDYITYRVISKILLNSIIPEERKRQSLKFILTNNPKLYSVLETTLKGENKSISIDELEGVLLAIDKRFPHSSLNEEKQHELVNLFATLLSGEKQLKNIVLVGRSGAGKSTFIATLLNPLDKQLHKQISGGSLFSTTVNTEDYYGVFESTDGEFFTARFIDTPGLSEVKPINVYSRSDEEIIDLIYERIKEIIDRERKIDQVVQIYQLNNRIEEIDIKAFKLLKGKLEEIYSDPIWLVFSKMDVLRDVFHKYVEELLDYFKNVSGINEKDYQKTFSCGTIFDTNIKTAERVLLNRNIFLESVFSQHFFEGLETIDERTFELSPPYKIAIEEIIPKVSTSIPVDPSLMKEYLEQLVLMPK